MRYPISGAIAALVLAVAALPATAATIFVDKYSPGPAHDGKSWQTAYTTIVAGYTAAKAGDEVWVGPGTYPETINLKPNVSLYGGFIGYEIFRDQRLGIQGITNLELISGRATVTATTSAITESTVVDGFTFLPDPTRSSVRPAISCDGASPTISHNVIVGMTLGSESLIRCSNAKVVIRNNIITACWAGTDGFYPAIILSGATGIIANNTIVGNGGYAIGGTGSVQIANNIVAFNAGAFAIGPHGTPPTYRNNCLYDNMDLEHGGTDPSGSNGNFTADPKFAVYAYGNLHFAADSPCRDAGDDSAVAAGDVDIDLQPRIQGAHVDIGADESDGRTWTFTPRIVRVSLTGNDANDGSSWALAKKSIQAGIDLASAYGGDVWVQAGVYTLATSAKAMINLPPYCYLYGGFSGTETSLNQRGWSANLTILSASNVGIMAATGGYHVSAVDGFVMTGGSAQTNLTAAGVACIGASPFIRNNVFIRNVGPVVQCRYSRPIITNNAFYNNNLLAAAYAYIVGGLACSPTVSGNVFSGNGSGTSIQGLGAVYVDRSSTFHVTDNMFEGNFAGSSINVATSGVQGQGVIANNTFINNRGIALNLFGGTAANNIVALNDTGIYSSPLNPVLSNCVYSNTKNYGQTDRTGRDGNISVYPMFNSLISGDYRLIDTSPCVDAGRDMYVQAGDVDLDGLPRIQGRSVDMGCYESSASSMIAHWGDIVRALRIAGGLTSGDATEIALIRGAAGGTEGIGLTDAESLIIRLTRGL